jgi:hypothetical protein
VVVAVLNEESLAIWAIVADVLVKPVYSVATISRIVLVVPVEMGGVKRYASTLDDEKGSLLWKLYCDSRGDYMV